jgi:hypothetical protein
MSPEEKIVWVRMVLKDKVDNPHFDANRAFAIRLINELEETIKTKRDEDNRRTTKHQRVSFCN